MTTKAEFKVTDYVEYFSNILGWHKARVKFFVLFIFSTCKLQTVCFAKLAQGFKNGVKVESNLRRIQRFFAEFVIDSDIISNLLFGLLPVKPPYRLCLDRTNWKFGCVDINILMISIAYEGVSIPIIWSMLPKKGNSSCEERKELLDRYIRLFGKDSIDSILADREFIGDSWYKDLIDDKIKFYIRIRENMWVHVPGKEDKKAFWLFNSLPLNTSLHIRKIVRLGNHWMYLSGLKVINKENRIEFVIVASYCFDPQALSNYKVRWQTETMFKALKTSGFNIEDTHLSDVQRISKLLLLLCVGFIWAYQTGIYRHENIKPITIKKHGRRQYSFFKYGLIFIANALLCNDYESLEYCFKVLSCT